MKQSRNLNRNLKPAFLTMLVMMFIFLTSCSGNKPDEDVTKQYYKGYEGVDIEFVDENPPNVFYYDSRAPLERDNSFDIMVKLQNKGAFTTYGALFISGYDKRMIDVSGDYDLANSGNYGTFSVSAGPDGLTLKLFGIFSGRVDSSEEAESICYGTRNTVTYMAAAEGL